MGSRPVTSLPCRYHSSGDSSGDPNDPTFLVPGWSLKAKICENFTATTYGSIPVPVCTTDTDNGQLLPISTPVLATSTIAWVEITQMQTQNVHVIPLLCTYLLRLVVPSTSTLILIIYAGTTINAQEHTCNFLIVSKSSLRCFCRVGDVSGPSLLSESNL